MCRLYSDQVFVQLCHTDIQKCWMEEGVDCSLINETSADMHSMSGVRAYRFGMAKLIVGTRLSQYTVFLLMTSRVHCLFRLATRGLFKNGFIFAFVRKINHKYLHVIFDMSVTRFRKRIKLEQLVIKAL